LSAVIPLLIKMDLKEIRWKGVEWIHLAQDRVQWQAPVNVVMNLLVPYKVGNLTERLFSFSRMTLLYGFS
jgi:hypothetical protein